MPARTLARYQHDAALHRLETAVVSCRPLADLADGERALFKAVAGPDSSEEEEGGGQSESHLALVTQETVFHPQGGGQPSDVGAIHPCSKEHQQQEEQEEEKDGGAVVLDVKLVRKLPNGEILHVGSLSRKDGSDRGVEQQDTAWWSSIFHPSRPVHLAVNSEKRDYHSRLHTAGHLIGLAVRHLQRQQQNQYQNQQKDTSSTSTSLLQGITEGKANHAPGSSFVEFHGLIGGALKDAIQDTANEFVAQDRSVLVRWWDRAQVRERCNADTVPEGVLSLTPGKDGDGQEEEEKEEAMRVVEIDGLGAYPCGGTHLPTTKDVGRVVVRKISRQKGTSKVSYTIE